MQPKDSTFIIEVHAKLAKEIFPFGRQHYPTLDEAMVALLNIPPERYHHELIGQYYQIGQLLVFEHNGTTERQIASILPSFIEDTFNGGLPAGVYLRYNDEHGNDAGIGELEKRLSAGFYKFRNYDHDRPMVQLARSASNERVGFEADPALEDLVKQLQKAVVRPWQYYLKVFDVSKDFTDLRIYHQQMPAVFDQLIALPYFSPKQGSPAVIPEDFPTVAIRDQKGQSLVRINLEAPSDTDPTKHAITMEVGMGLDRLEATAGISLAGLEGYRYDAARLIIGSMDAETREFNPAAAFARLQSSQRISFSIKFTYEDGRKKGNGPADPAPMSFPSIKTAMLYLVDIPKQVFDAPSPDGRMVRFIEITEGPTGQVVAQLFKQRKHIGNIFPGYYLKASPTHILLHLKELEPLLSAISQDKQLRFLLTPIQAGATLRKNTSRASRRPPPPRRKGKSR